MCEYLKVCKGPMEKIEGRFQTNKPQRKVQTNYTKFDNIIYRFIQKNVIALKNSENGNVMTS